MPYKYPRQSKNTFKVKRSFSGLGLFTKNPIKKGNFVIEYYGPLMDNKTTEEKGGKYLFGIDKKFTIDGSSRENLARYLNHSCKPNCEPELDGKRVFIYALKDIKPEEELTYNYGKEYFDNYIKPYGCRCGHHY